MTKVPPTRTTYPDPIRSEDPPVAPGSSEMTVALPAADLDGDRLSTLDQVWGLVRHWSRQALDGAQQKTSHPKSVYAAKPPSFAEYRAYVRSRAWLPEGYERGWLVWVPLTYYVTVGAAGVLLGLGTAWLFSRVLHFNIAVLVTTAIATLWLVFD
ncbi:hypothetical protein [Spirillospora sp. NBC_01491]|uniref:hypothetical protein n=1 Tax=Spirillospora sp. NBC_01491 TaxID=2976007 RepID=UPI002E3334B4|nr:hypothetical protein [Spirillospora sp. NBC_01491]